MNFYNLTTNQILFFFFTLFGFVLCSSCAQRERGCTDMTALNYNPDAIYDNGDCLYAMPTPTDYGFVRFGASSVNYAGMAATQCRIQTIEYWLQQLGSNTATTALYADTLLALYGTSTAHIIVQPPTSPPISPQQISDIGTATALSSLINKTYRADSIADTLLRVIKARSSNPTYLHTANVYTADNGTDAQQLLHTTLLGAVLYHQGAKILNDLTEFNNTLLVSGSNYTAMEHAWDEAFGYYGAATDLLQYAPAQLSQANTCYNDSNQDGSINPATEYNHANVQQASQLYTQAATTQLYNELIFHAFVTGRTAITNKNYTLRRQQAQFIVQTWETMLANSAYQNAQLLQTALQQLGTPQQDTAAVNRHWSAMRGYVLALQYNSQATISTEQLAQLRVWCGLQPVYDLSFGSNISQITTLLDNVYNF